MVFVLRQLQEKCIEQHQDLYILFVDLTKEFYTVSRSALWTIITRLGCPPKLVRMIWAFRDGMMARVVMVMCLSPFQSTAVSSRTVFLPGPSSCSASFISDAHLSSLRDGRLILIRFKTDGKFFDLSWLQVLTKVKEALIRAFLFADDCALSTLSTLSKLKRLANYYRQLPRPFAIQCASRRPKSYVN